MVKSRVILDPQQCGGGIQTVLLGGQQDERERLLGAGCTASQVRSHRRQVGVGVGVGVGQQGLHVTVDHVETVVAGQVRLPATLVVVGVTSSRADVSSRSTSRGTNWAGVSVSVPTLLVLDDVDGSLLGG